MLAHRTTINASFHSRFNNNSFVTMFFFYYDMTNNLHLFYIDSAESKNCAFDIRTENGVLPEKEICRPTHSDVSC